MELYLLDWANLLLRWLHVITAIAWVGSSFYFVWLDNHLVPPTSPDLQEKGISGALWAVHGGGFYNPQKYLGTPKKIHTELHWFYWESYSTWLSGFGLFTVLYLWNAGTFLVDKSVYAWSPTGAVAAALAFLAVFSAPGPKLTRKWASSSSASSSWRPGWPASCLPAAPPSCWWAR